MIRLLALISLLATTGCVVYPYGYGGYPYGDPAQYQRNAPAASDYNPVTGSRTGN